jgi:uncharacterized membrane protein YhaH (DUF805 family)
MNTQRADEAVTYDSLFVNPAGRSTRGQFLQGFIVLLAIVLFFACFVKGRTAMFCLLVLMYPGLTLHARRLHDMGRSAWLLALPAALLLAAFAIWLEYASFGGGIDRVLPMLAMLVAALFAAWGLMGKGRSANSL